MRIGTLAKMYSIPVETIRYYIEIGILLPEKRGQYYFDDVSIKDLELIQELKKARFSLKEIHKILSFKRVTGLEGKNDFKYLITLLNKKKEELHHEKNEIDASMQIIEKKIKHLEVLRNKKGNDTVKGVSISFIPLLYCPACQIQLRLDGVTIRDNAIINGTLHCPCGYIAKIEDGILITPNHQNLYKFDLCIFDAEKFEQFTPHFISLTEKGYSWIHKQMIAKNLNRKVIVETNIKYAAFIPKYIQSFHPNNLYVFSCYDVDVLQKLKNRIEQIELDLNVLFIANSEMDLPLKHQSIDFVIDSFSINDASLFFDHFPIDRLKPYVNKSGRILGNYVYYHKSAKSLKKIKEIFPNSHQETYSPNYLENNLKQCEFTMSQKIFIGNCPNPGDFFSYHIENDSINMFSYEAVLQPYT